LGWSSPATGRLTTGGSLLLTWASKVVEYVL
jgi:hypothetical protein